MEASNQEGIFRSAHEAIVFALNFAGQQYAMSPFARLMQGGAIGNGRGLSGLDGAAQAGMVIAALTRLDYYHAVALVARCANRQAKCNCKSECCKGWVDSDLWRDVTSIMTERAISALSGDFSHRTVRNASVRKFFGEKVTIAEIAEEAGVSERTAADQHAKIIKALKEIESRAWEAFNKAIESSGMLIREISEETA